MEIPEINDNFIWISDRDLFTKKNYSWMNVFHRLDLLLSNIEKIHEKYILFDCLDEYEPPAFIDELSWNFINKKLEQNNKHLLLILGSPDQSIYDDIDWQNTNIGRVNLPLSSIFWSIEEFQRTNFFQEVNEVHEIQYFIRCLNRYPHEHRCITIDKLHEYNLIENNFVSWNIINPNYSFKHFNQKKIIADYDLDTIHQNSVMFKKQQPSSLFDIVTESNTKFLFYSEKTWKSYLQNNSMSIFFGAVNQNISLQMYGFEMYDEILNYEFDSYDNYEDRIEGFLQQIIELREYDYREIYQEVKEKIKHNKNNVMKIFNEKKYLDETNKFLTNEDLKKHIGKSIFNNTIGYKTIKNLR